MSDAPREDAVPVERSLWFYLRTAISAAVLLLVVASGMVLIVLPKATGSFPLTVLTESMKPGFPPGTLMVVSPIKPAQVQIGDIVTYQITSGKPDVVTHRVIGIGVDGQNRRTFTFQGDNNALPDQLPVLPVQIKARLWYAVPYIGWAALWLNGDARQIIVPIAAGLLFAFAAYMFVSWGVVKVRGVRAPGSVLPVSFAALAAAGPQESPAPALVWADPDIWVPERRPPRTAKKSVSAAFPGVTATPAPAPLVWADADIWMPGARARAGAFAA